MNYSPPDRSLEFRVQTGGLKKASGVWQQKFTELFAEANEEDLDDLSLLIQTSCLAHNEWLVLQFGTLYSVGRILFKRTRVDAKWWPFVSKIIHDHPETLLSAVIPMVTQPAIICGDFVFFKIDGTSSQLLGLTMFHLTHSFNQFDLKQ